MNLPDSVLRHARRVPDYGPGCPRHEGDPHNLCEACWALEPVCNCLVPWTDGAGQHAPDCAKFKVVEGV